MEDDPDTFRGQRATLSAFLVFMSYHSLMHTIMKRIKVPKRIFSVQGRSKAKGRLRCSAASPFKAFSAGLSCFGSVGLHDLWLSAWNRGMTGMVITDAIPSRFKPYTCSAQQKS